MSSSSSSFKVVIRSEAVRHMTESAVSLTILAIKECAVRYGFSAEEALKSLNLVSLETVEVPEKKSRRARVGSSRVDVEKPKVVKAAFPLPYNGELNPMCCFGLRLCEGLYTQCRVQRKGESSSSFCKVCEEVAEKSNGIPAYGTIQERKACYDSNVEFKDPKGKSPVAYSRVMRKHKLTEAQVVEEAGKLNIVINPVHFTTVETETKRGRPKAANKAPKEPKGAKGRPKKSKKVLEIDGGEDDLFATLMAQANEESVSGSDDVSTSDISTSASAEEVEIPIKVKEPKKKALKAAEKDATKEAEKAAKVAEKEAEKLKKEQEKAKKEQEKTLKEAEKKLKDEAKEAEKKQKEEAKALKEAEKVAKEAAKALKEAEKALKAEKKDAAKSAPAASVADNEPDVVKRFEFEGKKYLKSKKTGIIYNMEQDVIGKWNDASNKIDFSSTDEEVEEEYEEEEEEEAEVDEE